MIRLDRQCALAVLTIDRPAKANALSAAMLEALTAHLAGLAREDVKAVLLTGTGRVFSAGADLDEAKAGLARSPLWQRLSAQVAAMPCLTIAALNGTLAGGAFGMAMACDLRIAVPEAQFFYPVMRLGYQPPQDDPERLVRLIGPSRARMILMAGARIGAEEARAWGLIDRIAPAASLQHDAEALAAAALAADKGHVTALKERLRAAAYNPALL